MAGRMLDALKFIVVATLGVAAVPMCVVAQCPDISFQTPVESCLNETIRIDNTSTYQDGAFVWDFCGGDLTREPSATSLVQVLEAASPSGVALVQQYENYFLFMTARTSNNLVRLDFGNDPRNAHPEIVDLGNPGNALKGPVGLAMVEEDGFWYGLTYNSQTDSLVRISFGPLVSNRTPAGECIAKGFASGNSNTGVAVGSSAGSVVAVLTNPVTSKLTLVNLGNSVTNTPDPADILTTASIPGASSLRGISLNHICGKWYGFAAASSSRKLFRFDFGTSLFSEPAAVDITGGFSGTENFQDIRVFYDGGAYVGFVFTLQGVMYRAEFGEDITALPELSSVGNLGMIASTTRFDFIKNNSEWTAFSPNTGTRFVYRVDFPNICSASTAVATGVQPEMITYQQPGAYQITLEVIDPSVGRSSFSREVIVEDKLAPDIGFQYAGACAAHDVTFTVTSASDLSDIHWDFSDGQISDEQDPVHHFNNPGVYDVALTVTGQNGCSNQLERSVSIYPQPAAAFTLPASLLCTNNALIFPTTTPDIYDGNLSYQWFIDDNPVSNARDLQYTFTNTSPKNIKLLTAIPGCSDEVTQTTPSFQPGPVVDFSFTGSCQEDAFAFTSEISDPVESYHWNFDDGNTSTEPNPVNEFTFYGDYSVSLTATTAIGCENVTTKAITVYARPVVDFSLEGPPNACSGTTTVFQNLTGSPDGTPITEWLWGIQDSGNDVAYPQENAEHVFAMPGTYTVSLAAVSEKGCRQSLDKEVVIHRGPATDFSFTSPCEDVPVEFTGSLDNTIESWYWEIGTSYYLTSAPTHTFAAPGDYPLYLQVVADNGCVSTVRRTIHVPEPLQPDFSILHNCVDREAVFSDITEGVDPVSEQQWFLNGMEIATGPAMTHVFDRTGSQEIRLHVTTASGCAYSTVKPVTITTPPSASFAATPPSGAWPLEVRFVNTSQNATHYQWQFLDGSDAATTVPAPVHTFNEAGSFEVQLTAYNEQQCSDVRVQTVTVLAPLPDADVEVISTTPNPDGSMKLIVTVHNKGNTVLKNVPLDIDFSGNLRLRQILDGPVNPGTQQNIVLNTGILDADALRYLCVYLNVEDDRFPEGNRMCKPFETTLLALPSYPNPAASNLTVEWISPDASTVHIILQDALGRQVFNAETEASMGLNRHVLDVSNLNAGIYYLRFYDGRTRITHRILVSGHP